MAFISRNVTIPSVLNPNAPIFVPMEDFSDEWWALIHSSQWYQEYWLKYQFKETKNKTIVAPVDDHVLPDIDSLVDIKEEEEEKRDYNKDLVTLGALKWRKIRSPAETPRFAEKAPKIVNKKMIPRPIQQPR